MKSDIYKLKNLTSFSFIDVNRADKGESIREKAKNIINLLEDKTRLAEERLNYGNWKNRIEGVSSSGKMTNVSSNSNSVSSSNYKSNSSNKKGGMGAVSYLDKHSGKKGKNDKVEVPKKEEKKVELDDSSSSSEEDEKDKKKIKKKKESSDEEKEDNKKNESNYHTNPNISTGKVPSINLKKPTANITETNINHNRTISNPANITNNNVKPNANVVGIDEIFGGGSTNNEINVNKPPVQNTVPVNNSINIYNI